MLNGVMSLAYTPCPNDTYMFSALAAGQVGIDGIGFDIRLHDIEELNRLALRQRYDITKVSCYAWLRIREHYRLLETGAAFGYEYGPLLLAAKPLATGDLKDCRIAFPGELTTAWLLYQLCGLDTGRPFFIPYNEIISRILAGEFDCGVIIHESRFTCEASGLHPVIDLGQWWRQETGFPVPLGCFVIRREFSEERAKAIENLMQCSLGKSSMKDIAVNEYITRHAQETDITILDQHIRTYVNSLTSELGEVGHAAMEALADRARQKGIVA